LSIQEFIESTEGSLIPAGLPLHVQALWYDKKGNWKKAHDLIDHLGDRASAHVHAYLHRKEGDLWNAGYWYNRAGHQMPDVSLEKEWMQLAVLYLP